MLCRQSKYFRKLCGPGSAFAESEQREIEFVDDDPDTFAALVHYLYNAKGDSDSAERQQSWDYYLNLRITGDKYLCMELKMSAEANLCAKIESMSDTTMILSILRTLQDEHPDDAILLRLAAQLRKTHFHKLIKDKGYRSYLDEDKERLWAQLDELIPFTKEQKTVVSCTKCSAIWWKSQAANHTVPCAYIRPSPSPPHRVTERACFLSG